MKAPVCRLAPSADNFLWHTWWHFSTQFFIQFPEMMEFTSKSCFTNSVTAEGPALFHHHWRDDQKVLTALHYCCKNIVVHLIPDRESKARI